MDALAVLLLVFGPSILGVLFFVVVGYAIASNSDPKIDHL
jgi:hypothetical protein